MCKPTTPSGSFPAAAPPPPPGEPAPYRDVITMVNRHHAAFVRAAGAASES